MTSLTIVIVAFDGFEGSWYFKAFRILILLSSIIPISMRVNLDFAKIYYSYLISTDEKHIPGCISRNSTIPEELGRIQYMFSDKTGTLTQNDMVFKKVAMEFTQFTEENMNELSHKLRKPLQGGQHMALNKSNEILNSLDSDSSANPGRNAVPMVGPMADAQFENDF
jgi:phospholipid-translocating ATPase